jgi:hypothetical protein
LNSINLSSFSQFDIIGDIHGYGSALVQLLQSMGYTEIEKYNYAHPEGRKVIFIGDYIDRGPEILMTLRIVRTMQENGNAIAIMGNHEYNFLCYAYTSDSGNYFRKHSKKHDEEWYTDHELGDEKSSYLDWMARLPLFFENDYVRCVHAHWDKKSIDLIRDRGIAVLDEQGLRALHSDQELLDAYEIVLKGAEDDIPEEYHYTHKGVVRKEARRKWWLSEPGKTMGTNYATLPDHLLDVPFEMDQSAFVIHYKHEEKPVFFGHYWMAPKDFNILRDNICCLDFSIANKGVLAAYRFTGENQLNVLQLIHHEM